MDNFMVGFFIAVALVLIGLLLFFAGYESKSIDIAEQCKAYQMANIDNKVYNCTIKEK